MTFPLNNNPITPRFLLFGRGFEKVPPFPLDGQVMVFNGVSNQWELGAGGGGGEANTSSNVGTGDGLALPKVGVDLPFKSLLDSVEVVITVTATTLDFSIGAIAISKITGLQVALDSKIETASNVGTGVDVFKQKTGTDLEFRTMLANLEVLITQNVSDLAFSIGAIAQSKKYIGDILKIVKYVEEHPSQK